MTIQAAIEIVLVIMVLTNMMLLGSSRLRTCIHMVALQGAAAGLFPLLLHASENPGQAALMAVVSVVIKGIVLPFILLRNLRETGARSEVEPFISHTLSVGVGVLALLFSLWMASLLPVLGPGQSSPLIIPVGMATLLIGLTVIISRRKAISQVLGYIVLENGIFLFGLALGGGVSTLLELGVLMDVFVGVFIMGIAAHQINLAMDHTDVDRLDQMRG